MSIHPFSTSNQTQHALESISPPSFLANSTPSHIPPTSSPVNTHYVASSVQTAENSPKTPLLSPPISQPSFTHRAQKNIYTARSIHTVYAQASTQTPYTASSRSTSGESNKKIADLETTIATLTQEKVELAKTLEKEKAHSSSLESDNEMNFQKLSNAARKISELEQDILVLREEINCLQAKASQTRTEQRTDPTPPQIAVPEMHQLALFNQEIDEPTEFNPRHLCQMLSFLRQDVTSLLQTANSTYSEARNTNVVGNRALNQLEEELKKKDELIQSLRDREIELLTTNRELEKENHDVKKENQDVKKENQGVKKENQDVKKENQDLKKENQDLRNEKAELKKVNTQQSTQLTCQKVIMTRQQEQLTLQTTLIKKEQSTVSEQEDKISSLKYKRRELERNKDRLETTNSQLSTKLEFVYSDQVVIVNKNDFALKRVAQVLMPDL